MVNSERKSTGYPKMVLRYGEEGNSGTFSIERIVIEGKKITYYARFADGRHTMLTRRLTNREVGYIYETENVGKSAP